MSVLIQVAIHQHLIIEDLGERSKQTVSGLRKEVNDQAILSGTE
ncbi:MAG: hypothetical protein AAF388_29300 [Bacteroidota bacterium]